MPRITQRPPVAVSIALALAAALGAQQPPAAPASAPPTAAIRSDATTMILPAGRITLRQLIDATAQFLQCNILAAEQELAQCTPSVNLQTPMQLDRQQAEDVVSGLLYTSGLVLITRNQELRIHEVIACNGPRAGEIAKNAPERSPEEILARPELKRPVTTVLPLQRLQANIAVNMLRPFFASARGGGGVGLTFGNADATGLLLSGLQSDVAAAIELVRKADGGAAPAAVDPTQAQRIEALERAVAELRSQVDELKRQLAGR